MRCVARARGAPVNRAQVLRAACCAALAGCAGDLELTTCDIREPSCQFEVFLAVQDVRGSLWDPWLEPPPMEVISEAQYRAQVIAARERALEQEGVNYLNEGLKLLRMIDPDETPDEEADFQVASVAALYDSRTHRVTIIDRDEPGNPVLAVQTLAHELVHAAQDRDVGFRRLFADVGSTDQLLALSTLLEGEAVMYGFLVDGKQLDIPKTLLDWGVVYGWLDDVRMRTFQAASPYRLATTELIYPLGGAHAVKAYLAGGPLAVRGSYDHPPLSAAELMASLGTAPAGGRTPWGCALVEPPAGFELALADELGALALYAFATRSALAEPQAWDRAQPWVGDRFQVFRRPDDPDALAVAWLVRFADAQAAAALHALIGSVAWPQPLQSRVVEDMVHVFASKPAVSEPYDAWTRCRSP